MRRALTAGLLIVALAALGYAGYSTLRHNAPPQDSEPYDLGPIGEFSLTERSGRTVTNADLAGKVWIASFVFTRCTGGCPQVSGTMVRLQEAFRNESDIRLVTFTVDPERDNPAELKEYAEHFGADPERWLFLTGSEKLIHQLIQKGFKVPVELQYGPGCEARQRRCIMASSSCWWTGTAITAVCLMACRLTRKGRRLMSYRACARP